MHLPVVQRILATAALYPIGIQHTQTNTIAHHWQLSTHVAGSFSSAATLLL
jgi:hypothetical protein